LTREQFSWRKLAKWFSPLGEFPPALPEKRKKMSDAALHTLLFAPFGNFIPSL